MSDPLLLDMRAARRCVYHDCGESSVIIAMIVAGDADELHQTPNGLCSRHQHQVLEEAIQSMLDGGWVKSMTLVLP